jgi:hypothetical protein
MNDHEPITEQPSQTATSDEGKPSEPARTRRGKVARLPKAVRDQINVMLLDGVPFAEILQKLGERAKDVTEHNITSWVAGGYKDWLREQQRLEETRVKQEVAMDLACSDGGSKIHEGILQLAATRLSEMVRNLDYTDFEGLLRDDPSKLIQFLNALARISEAEIKCERHRFEADQRKSQAEAKELPQKSAGLRPETRHQLEKELNIM